jgi:uncharacterized LabA/DUF88 family protein
LKRVLVLVDGLNLLHAVRTQSGARVYLDVFALSERLVNWRTEALVGLNYFTAMANHLSDEGRAEQLQFLKLLKRQKCNIVLGEFHKIAKLCPRCRNRTISHSEKQTDVNIATSLLVGAYENSYDKVLLFSADSDLVPAIRLVKEKFPDKEIKMVSTVAFLRPVHATMGRLSDGQIRLTPELIAPHLITYKEE